MLSEHEPHITIYICDRRLIDEQLLKRGTCFYHLQQLEMMNVSAVATVLKLSQLLNENTDFTRTTYFCCYSECYIYGLFKLTLFELGFEFSKSTETTDPLSHTSCGNKCEELDIHACVTDEKNQMRLHK